MGDRESGRGRLPGVLAAWTLMLALAACGQSPMTAPGYLGDDVADRGRVEASVAEAPAAAMPPAEAGSGAASAPPAALNAADRKLVFTGQMQLEVEDVAKAMAAARAWVAAHDGFVESESSGAGYEGQGQGQGSMTLRMPSARYEDARAYLREQAREVRSDESQRQDVTSQYADMDARLENLKAAERELRILLTEARQNSGNVADILAVQEALTAKRGEIDALEAQLNALSEQVALSTIRVAFLPPPSSAAEVTESWQPGEVFRQALADVVGAFQWLLDVLIYLLVTAPFWLLFVLLAWGLWRLIRRLRRRRGARAGPGDEPVPAPPPLPGA